MHDTGTERSKTGLGQEATGGGYNAADDDDD